MTCAATAGILDDTHPECMWSTAGTITLLLSLGVSVGDAVGVAVDGTMAVAVAVLSSDKGDGCVTTTGAAAEFSFLGMPGYVGYAVVLLASFLVKFFFFFLSLFLSFYLSQSASPPTTNSQ